LKTLLIHPEDSPCSGPWAAETWDCIVDLGRASAFTIASWQERLDLPILQLDSLRHGIEDFAFIRELLQAGRNQLVDESRIDWWDLISAYIYSALEQAVVLGRLAESLDAGAELYTTRPGWPSSGVALLMKRPLHTFPGTSRASQFRRSGDLLRRFSFDQLAQIFLDKYDPRYRLRTRFVARRQGSQGPVVLLPSAYTNVSRMAVAYASMLPEQSFLLVATRRSGTHFDAVPNVASASLAAYAGGPEPQAEYLDILARWGELKQSLTLLPEMDLLIRAGMLNKFPGHLRDGLAVRDAWRNVLSQEQVAAVMCGDDSNPYTRLPVLLACQQGIPTLDFHHGALDGRFLVKELFSDVYMAKGEMERDYLLRICRLPAEHVMLAGPPRPKIKVHERSTSESPDIIFFSEPYESMNWRTEEIYRELLPPLAKLAQEVGSKLVVKLHPFESRHERVAIIAKVLLPEDAVRVEVVEGPFTPQLVRKAWFAVTVESTTVIDCSLLGVPCFLCEWFNSSLYGYTQQYARFGVGRILNSPEQLNHLPQLLMEPAIPLSENCLVKPMDPDWLRQIITTGVCTEARKVPQAERS
jgi:hypothetical protein